MFAATFGDPAKETAHASAFPPHQPKEFAGVEIGGRWAEECFHAPAKVRTFPGRETVSLSGDPVIAKRVQHVLEAGVWKLETEVGEAPWMKKCDPGACTDKILTESKLIWMVRWHWCGSV